MDDSIGIPRGMQVARVTIPPGTILTAAARALPVVVVESLPGDIVFSTGDKEVLRIRADGGLVRGEGLSNDEASAAFYECLSTLLPCWITALRQRAEHAEAELAALRADGETR